MQETVEALSAVLGIDLKLTGRGTWEGPITEAQWTQLENAVEAEKVPA